MLSCLGSYILETLPLDMRDMNISLALFKSKLKTFLCMRAFPGAFETQLMGALQMTIYTFTYIYYPYGST